MSVCGVGGVSVTDDSREHACGLGINSGAGGIVIASDFSVIGGDAYATKDIIDVGTGTIGNMGRSGVVIVGDVDGTKGTNDSGTL